MNELDARVAELAAELPLTSITIHTDGGCEDNPGPVLALRSASSLFVRGSDGQWSVGVARFKRVR